MKRAFALVAASAVSLAACGSGGDDTTGSPDDQPRAIEVTMTDMAFSPNEIDVTAGETVTFVFRNDGAVRHEAVFGDLAEQQAHHAEMADAGGTHAGMDGGSMPHEQMSELHAVIVEPGETVEMSHTFDSGSTMIGCHEPGHWEAGMQMSIDV